MYQEQFGLITVIYPNDAICFVDRADYTRTAMRKFLYSMLILSLVFSPVSYSIASSGGELVAKQDCEHCKHHSAGQHQKSKCHDGGCCDVKCDSKCTTGFHVVTALLADLLHDSFAMSHINASEIHLNLEGIPPSAEFRPPILVS